MTPCNKPLVISVTLTNYNKTENMKRITLILVSLLLATAVFSQTDTSSVKVLKKNVVTVTESPDKTEVIVGDGRGVEVITNQNGDTTSIRIGNRNFDVIENHDGTKIHMSRESQPKKKSSSRFDGTWSGIGLGMNTFYQTDYSLYNDLNQREFFDLQHNKSLTFHLNFAEYAFANERKSFGLVTGLGISFMDFRFDQPVTVAKAEGTGLLVPVNLDPETLVKSKLNVTYLTAPLMLEVATPLKYKSNRLTFAAGIIGGLNIGSHTKVKTDEGKSKERRNFNVNPYKYDLTGRIGFGDISLFVNYGMTPLFKEGKGPELIPVTVGIAITD